MVFVASVNCPFLTTWSLQIVQCNFTYYSLWTYFTHLCTQNTKYLVQKCVIWDTPTVYVFNNTCIYSLHPPFSTATWPSLSDSDSELEHDMRHVPWSKMDSSPAGSWRSISTGDTKSVLSRLTYLLPGEVFDSTPTEPNPFLWSSQEHKTAITHRCCEAVA